MVSAEFWLPEPDRIRRVRDGQVITYNNTGQTPAPNLTHAVRPRTTSHTNLLGQRLYILHRMSNGLRSSDDKHYLLTYMGAVTSQSALPVGLVLADFGKSWKTTDTGNLWTWTGSAWFNQGARPAYNVVGKKYLNPDDYVVKNFLPPAPARSAAGWNGGTASAESPYMGQQRDIPPFAPRRGGTTADMVLANAVEQLREDVALGVDGYGLYMPTLEGVHWDRVKASIRAAEIVQAQDGIAFPIILQTDGKTESTSNVRSGSTISIDASADALANTCLTVIDSPALARVGGKPVIGTFGPELTPHGLTVLTSAERLKFWTRFKSSMSAAGKPIVFAPSFLSTPTTFLDAGWTSVVDIVNLWGDADPTSAAGDTVRNRRFAGTMRTSYNLPAWVSVRHHDSRPREGVMWEEGGGDLLRTMWSNIRGVAGSSIYQAATWVHGITGDDFPEHTHMLGSPANGGSALSDMIRYYLEWWQTDAAPEILRDGLYLRHRKHFWAGTTYTGIPERGKTSPLISQTDFIDTVKGATAVRNEIDVEVHLTDAAEVRVLANGALVKSVQAPAGVSTVKAPLTAGRISAEAWRGGTRVAVVNSNTPVSTSQPFQDLYPRTFSSLLPEVEDVLATPTTGPTSGGTTTGGTTTGGTSSGGTASAVTWRLSGGTTFTGTTIAVKTPNAQSVRVALSTSSNGGTSASRIYSTAKAPRTFGESQHVFTGLTPNTQYYYAAETDGALAAWDGKVKTLPQTGTVKIGVASCSESNSNHAVFATMAARGWDGLWHLGDMHYGDLGSSVEADYAFRWNGTLSLSNPRKLWGQCWLDYIVSDHDGAGGNNNSTTRPAGSAAANGRVFRRFFPTAPLPATDGIGLWRQTQITNRVRMFFVDTRTYRSSQSTTDGPSKTMMGAQQKQAFKDAVIASPAGTLWFFLFETHGWISGETANADNWRGYFTERTEIANFMKDQKATRGINFYAVGGDSHSTAWDDGTHTAHGGPHAMCSPIIVTNSGGGGSGPWTIGPFPPKGSYGTTRFRNICEFEINDPGTGPITVGFTAIDDRNGSVIIPTKTVSF